MNKLNNSYNNERKETFMDTNSLIRDNIFYK